MDEQSSLRSFIKGVSLMPHEVIFAWCVHPLFAVVCLA
jgi:hypothetical protein